MTAGATPTPTPVPAIPAPRGSTTAPAGRVVPDVVRPAHSLVAGGHIPDVEPGTVRAGSTASQDLATAAQWFVDRLGTLGGRGTADGEWVKVASFAANMPEERRLTRDMGDQAVVRAVENVISREALVASGGLCAPVTPYYDIMVLAGAQRPVRDSFATFQADRGGIRLIPPPTLASVGPTGRQVTDLATNTNTTVTSVSAHWASYDVGATITGTGIPAGTVIAGLGNDGVTAYLSAAATATATGVTATITRPGAVGYIPAATDGAALGGTAAQIASAIKPCLHIICGSPVEYDIAAVSRCLEVGNFSARTYPEQVAAWLKLAISQQARVAETQLLNFMSTNSTQITLAQVLGAARDIIPEVIKMGSYFRQHNRMDPEETLHWWGPAWLLDAMVADLIRGSVYDADYLKMVRNLLTLTLASEANVNVTWYQDSGTGKGQYFNSGNAQAAGAATAFPGTAVHYLTAEGSFGFLDGGTLDLGIVRDSVLNSQNNYRIFAEDFEAGFYVGVESLEMTSTILVNGAGALPVTVGSGL